MATKKRPSLPKRRPLTPADLDPVEAAASEISSDPSLGAPAADPMDQPRTAEELRAMGLMAEAEPGPRGIDGLPVDTGRAFSTEREARAYVTRQPITETDREFMRQGLLAPAPADARFYKSPRDLANNARGYQEVINDDGSVAYMPAAPSNEAPGDQQLPFSGGPGRAGRRMDLESQMTSNGQPVWVGKDGSYHVGSARDGDAPAVRFEATALVPQGQAKPGDYVSPTGAGGYVYAPSDATRDRSQAQQDEQRLYRMAEAAGMTPQEYLKQFPERYKNVEMGGVRGGFGERMAVKANRQKKREDIAEQLRAVGMLTGGRPSWGPGGSGTVANQYLTLPQDWRSAVMAQNLAPGLDGTTPLTVEAQSAKNALRLFNAELLSQGASNPVVAEKMRQQQRDTAKQEFDKYFDKEHGGSVNGGMWTRPYDSAAFEQRVTYMMNQYQIGRPEAEAIASSRGSPVSARSAGPTQPPTPGMTDTWPN